MTVLVQWPPIYLNNISEQHDLFSAEAKREPVFTPERLDLLVVRKVGSGLSHTSFQP